MTNEVPLSDARTGLDRHIRPGLARDAIMACYDRDAVMVEAAGSVDG